MPQIRQLDPALINKIAAGEVIERPASVVKELVENALDAGATRIDVALEEGGSTLIRVTDNGGGIPPDELPLAVASHATSKIATSDDLFRVTTLGFRGEALASIASVSHFRIVSRTPDRLEAYELLNSTETAPTGNLRTHDSGLKTQDSGLKTSLCSAPPGTTVEIRNLFYNVPARRKFLRHASTELANVTEQVARVALSHPGVAFTLSHNGRQLRNLPTTTDRRTRIADFYGPELAACLLPIHRDERGLRIEALIAPPAQSRPSSKWQYVFLNGRFISDRRIAYAVREAFRGLVEHDRYPVVFLFLTAPADSFDVNVHPTKIEVRWRDAGLVQSQVLAVLRETLLSHDLTPRLGFNARTFTGAPPTGERTADERSFETRQALADYLKSVDPTQSRLNFAPPRFPSDSLRPSIRSVYRDENVETPTNRNVETNEAPRDRVEDPPWRGTEGPSEADSFSASGLKTQDSGLKTQDSGLKAQDSGLPPQASSLIQIHNTYIVAETGDGIMIIDQHALHERILYERFRDRILAGPLESQRMLVPATIEVSPTQAIAATEHAELLARLGIEVTAFGPTTLAVQSFPTLLPNLDVAAFVSDLLETMGEGNVETSKSRNVETGDRLDGGSSEADSFGDSSGTSALAELRSQDSGLSLPDETLLHKCLDMMACKAAVKAGDPLTTDEMQALLSQRHVTARSSNCPHGRPTTLELSTRDLEKQFKRI
ncbi:MAG: DNA mismatch repair endonuclease MutL [Planctomycetes bacterium]|nr:DNA mismatch repair endonuclease MutL [Planctomycetota bacterium]